MDYIITNDPISTFKLNLVKSFRFSDDGCFLEITDWFNNVYRKFYQGKREEGIQDYNTIVDCFERGMY